jgi:hypothetical protein
MSSDPPVDFQQLAQGQRGLNGSDYPYAIKATDLMKNFVFATLVLNEGTYKEQGGKNGHTQRQLRLKGGTQRGDIAVWDGENWAPFPPPAGSASPLVLGYVGGSLTWLETEACEE